MPVQKFLILQTAFIGDAILATSLPEKIHQFYPEAIIDFMVRKGNESLFLNHPFINQIIVWDKKNDKFKNLFRILCEVRKEKYDYIVNLQRFASTGIFTSFSKAKVKIGFSKNPFSFLFDLSAEHSINNQSHEIARNHKLISHLTDSEPARPKLYPSAADFEKVNPYKSQPYICISPASVWFTKQFPFEKWIEFIEACNPEIKIYLLGGPADFEFCDGIAKKSKRENLENLAGKLSFLESAALMKNALMNYTNDSAPLHLASAMNTPVTAIFCSTSPGFGFGPLSDKSRIVETRVSLSCKPCGLHGKKACPEKHFKCGYTIEIKDLL